MKDFTQIFIAALGIPAIVLIGRKDRRLRKWGYIFGLAGQPFWVWSSWHAGQWGILILSVMYFFCWGEGLWSHSKR